MKFALFIGCNIPARVGQYLTSARAVLDRLGVELADFRSFGCCGYPLRSLDQQGYLLSSVRNLAIAEDAGLDILALCKCCFGSLKKAAQVLKESPSLKEEINRFLGREGLEYQSRVQVKHILSVLYHDVGLEALQGKIIKPYQGLKVAPQVGCHALRPSLVTQFDDPLHPVIFDALVRATGAESLAWDSRLDCCGAPLLGVNDEVSLQRTRDKIKKSREAGADYLCTACPFCHLQFETAQKRPLSSEGSEKPVAPLLYTQLLGLSLGIEEERLWSREDSVDSRDIRSYIREDEKHA
jgi:heterodisulfide reductase subunit B2